MNRRQRSSGHAADAPAGAGAALALLHIGAEQTTIGRASAPLVLALGWRKTAGQHFKHGMPSASELEAAIATVEDELARARGLIVAGSALVTTDAAIREIALVAGVNRVAAGAPTQLTLEAVEQCFGRLVAVTLGRPAASEGIPARPEFAATLLILRECMHHLRFAAITVQAGAPVAPAQ